MDCTITQVEGVWFPDQRGRLVTRFSSYIECLNASYKYYM
uniref:Uncharacterized protein n=1 Tax=Zea mays TaxID=4577 RepID=C0P7M2_MAIZE|nr:unknown [Zea mays]